MKKTEKAPVKPGLPKKAAAAAKKSRRKSSGKYKKAGGDALRAVILAGILIASAAFISMTAITIHSTVKSGSVPTVVSVSETISAPEISPVPEAAPQPPLPPQIEPLSGTSLVSKTGSVPEAAPETSSVPMAAKPPASTGESVSINTAQPVSRQPQPAKPVLPAVSEKSSSAKPTSPPPPVAQPAPAAVPVAVVKSANNSATVTTAAAVTAAKQHRGNIVIIIDDAGNNLRELEPFLRFPGPLTIAVLPGLPHSAEAARRIRAAGKEVFLHQPMEAVGGQAPGPGAIYSGMSASEIRAILRRNIAEIGPIAGMNNHQGSKITMDEQAMITVLVFCREQGLYFLDSRTTAETAAPAAAQRLNMTIGARDIFIDNDQSKAAMTRSINEGIARLRRQDSVVMIGHAWSADLAALLAETHSSLASQGYSFISASALVSGRGE